MAYPPDSLPRETEVTRPAHYGGESNPFDECVQCGSARHRVKAIRDGDYGSTWELICMECGAYSEGLVKSSK